VIAADGKNRAAALDKGLKAVFHDFDTSLQLLWPTPLTKEVTRDNHYINCMFI
jgi:hypothetical protein